jgi:site-specific DNA-methyltransferase (adenine-specific)
MNDNGQRTGNTLLRGGVPKPSRRRWWSSRPPGPILHVPGGEILCGDAYEFLSALRTECADIVFLDPPFNLGKTYGLRKSEDDRLDEQEYSSYVTSVLREACRVLKRGGALYFYHLPLWAVLFGKELSANLQFRHWIAIAMKNGFVRGDRLYPAHYALLYFTKGKPTHFRRPKIPTPRCRHCDSYLHDYGGYERFVRKGINLSDVWDDVSPVRHNKHKHRRSNELPTKIPARAVQISGSAGGVFVDPFGGSGAALLAAQEAGMRLVACDIERTQCQLMHQRLTKRHSLTGSESDDKTSTDWEHKRLSCQGVFHRNAHQGHKP